MELMTHQLSGLIVQKQSTVGNLLFQLSMDRGISRLEQTLKYKDKYLRTWLNADELIDTYSTRVEYQCVNGSQFDVQGGPNMTVEIR